MVSRRSGDQPDAGVIVVCGSTARPMGGRSRAYTPDLIFGTVGASRTIAQSSGPMVTAESRTIALDGPTTAPFERYSAQSHGRIDGVARGQMGGQQGRRQ
jgi:hypothetical protein